MIAIVGTGGTAAVLAKALSARGERPGRARTAGGVPAEAGAAFVVTGDDRSNLRLLRELRRMRPDLLLLA